MEHLQGRAARASRCLTTSSACLQTCKPPVPAVRSAAVPKEERHAGLPRRKPQPVVPSQQEEVAQILSPWQMFSLNIQSQNDWVRGKPQTPHPTSALSLPAPQGPSMASAPPGMETHGSGQQCWGLTASG